VTQSGARSRIRGGRRFALQDRLQAADEKGAKRSGRPRMKRPSRKRLSVVANGPHPILSAVS
jgi:hypothetical protein